MLWAVLERGDMLPPGWMYMVPVKRGKLSRGRHMHRVDYERGPDHNAVGA